MDSASQGEPTQVLDNLDLDLIVKVLSQTIFSWVQSMRPCSQRLTRKTKTWRSILYLLRPRFSQVPGLWARLSSYRVLRCILLLNFYLLWAIMIRLYQAFIVYWLSLLQKGSLNGYLACIEMEETYFLLLRDLTGETKLLWWLEVRTLYLLPLYLAYRHCPGASGIGELIANTMAVRNVTTVVMDVNPIVTENCTSLEQRLIFIR